MKKSLALGLCLCIAGCGESHTGGEDAGTLSGQDGSVVHMDGGSGSDAGPSGTDAGPATSDAGPSGSDASIPTRPGAVGSACTMDSDCTEPPGSMCQTTIGSGRFSYTFPGGYCSAMCTAGSGSTECGAGADCYTIGFGGFGTSFCVKMCTADSDCRTAEGYTCQRPPLGGGSTMYCLPPRPSGGGDGGAPFPGFDGSFPSFDGSFPSFDGGF